MEKKYYDLLEVSERLTEDLNAKQESFMVIDSQVKALATENAQIATLKDELAQAMAMKTELEHQVRETQNCLHEVNKEVVQMQRNNQDHLDVS